MSDKTHLNPVESHNYLIWKYFSIFDITHAFATCSIPPKTAVFIMEKLELYQEEKRSDTNDH
jgi:hypothetical protein